MATEFPDDPEVDLGFRDPATENSTPEIAEELKPQMELRLEYETPVSKVRLNNPWWSLRITIMLFLSAFGGLVSSIFLFERSERPTIFKHWKREVYTAAKTIEAPPATANLDLRLDQLRGFRIGGDGDSLGGTPVASQAPDESMFLFQQPPPFDAVVQLSVPAPPIIPFQDFPTITVPETVAAENVGRKSATQTQSTVRTMAEKMRRREATRIRRRITKRVARGAKSIASLWKVWSRHFLIPGLAKTSPNRRSITRKSFTGKYKASPWFPLSWHAVAPRRIKHEIPRTTAPHSSIRGGAAIPSKNALRR